MNKLRVAASAKQHQLYDARAYFRGSMVTNTGCNNSFLMAEIGLFLILCLYSLNDGLLVGVPNMHRNPLATHHTREPGRGDTSITMAKLSADISSTRVTDLECDAERQSGVVWTFWPVQEWGLRHATRNGG